MRKTTLLTAMLGAIALTLPSCRQDGVKPASSVPIEQAVTSKLNAHQALTYAHLFGTLAENSGKPASEARALDKPKEIDHISYCIDGRDTLMYAINYKNDEGYILISADNSQFPILAHGDKGGFDFASISKDNPLYTVLEGYKSSIKANLHNPNRVNTEYYQQWKDIGNKDYQYEIEVTNDAPVSELRGGTREHSTGKKTIYPYTGMALDKWCQEGGFNSAAPNNARIGCPAVAIGMLLYDTGHRPTGQYTYTHPQFSYYLRDAEAKSNMSQEVSSLLRVVADNIPNYRWGVRKDALSGASPGDILTGLRRLGYKDAELVPYDFELLYKNLSINSTSNRGVLIGAYHSSGEEGGHIWFCDGYYEQSYTVTKKFLFFKVKSWKEYDDRLYMNWGWAEHNGWFLATGDGSSWVSHDQKSQYYKLYPQMYINLKHDNDENGFSYIDEELR